MGCGSEDFTPEERVLLGAFVLPAAPPASPSNAVADDPRAAALGHQFFFDSRYSGPLMVAGDPIYGGLALVGAGGQVACVSCHDPADGGVDHSSRGVTSLAAGWTRRAAPTVLNAAHYTTPWMFWDGRKDSLWSQALAPPEGVVELNSSRLEVVHFVHAYYQAPYQLIFGPLPDFSDIGRFPPRGKPGQVAFDSMAADDRVAVDRVYSNFGKAIEAYERKLIDQDSDFDRYMRGDPSALGPSAIRGAKLFVGRAACNECHAGPTLSDGKFHNHGVPQIVATVSARDLGRADGIAQVKSDAFNQAGIYSDARQAGHLDTLEVQERDVGAFKTPTLRNCTKTAPFMHTSGLQTLWDVVAWYRDAAATDQFVGTRDPAVRPLMLSNEDVTDLVEFLKSLDGAPLPQELVGKPVLP